MLLAERLSRLIHEAVHYHDGMMMVWPAMEYAIEAAHKAIGCPDPAQAVLMQTRALGDLRLLLPRDSSDSGDPA